MGNRGWVYPARRNAGGGARRDEGLNERGEAPPPYVPEEQTPVRRGETGGGDGVGETGYVSGGEVPGVAVPLRTLSRGRQKPPDYREAVA